MPRLSKKYKQEWAFFLDHRNRMKYNELWNVSRASELSLSIARSREGAEIIKGRR